MSYMDRRTVGTHAFMWGRIKGRLKSHVLSRIDHITAGYRTPRTSGLIITVETWVRCLFLEEPEAHGKSKQINLAFGGQNSNAFQTLKVCTHSSAQEQWALWAMLPVNGLDLPFHSLPTLLPGVR